MAELWRIDDNNFALYIEAKHTQEIKNIHRSRGWPIMATYQKGDKIVGLQWRVPEWDYRKAKRIEKRINDVHESVEKAAI
ncbi:hypothetical protein U5N28_16230 [Lysinibacillus telephonicus]|uniref:hypothetical protein n=1 Tax=Lysinibacillus telephonicus TaxID=1714840 RepID=UPI00397BB037